MPSILKIKILQARDLPIMDKSSDLTDAYAQIKFADHDPARTAVCRKTLNPVWNEDFRFEVSDDAELQNEPLEVKVLDYDAISANDSVGTVYIDLNLLLVNSTSSLGLDDNDDGEDLRRSISGWFPLYDTIRGIRGQLEIQVKLQFFGDVNPFKDSSAGVQLFSITDIPSGYKVDQVFGLAEVLSSEDDPEYHWADSFRTPRNSNDARQKLMYRLSGQLRRLMGREVLEIGGNAIFGYKQSFDLEKEEGIITARAIGTCVTISPVSIVADDDDDDEIEHMMEHDELADENTRMIATVSRSNSKVSIPSAIPSANEMESADTSRNGTAEVLTNESLPLPSEYVTSPISAETNYRMAPVTLQRNLSMHRPSNQLEEVKLLNELEMGYSDPKLMTLHHLPQHALQSIGGIVSARSVKLLENDEEETRDSWWSELREEIQSHSKVLQCNAILGYNEETTIQDELIVLSASGTAVNVDFSFLARPSVFPSNKSKAEMIDTGRNEVETDVFMSSGDGIFHLESSVPCSDTEPPAFVDNTRTMSRESSDRNLPETIESTTKRGIISGLNMNGELQENSGCRSCHIPYHHRNCPFPMSTVKCRVCKKKYVPEIIISTIDPPLELFTIGTGCFVEAYVCRSKKRKEGETNAGIVSDALPFIEYDLHRQLLYKLRIQGLNAIFGLQIHLTIGEGLIVAVATGTATYVCALPPPPPLKVLRSIQADDTELTSEQRIMDLSEANRYKMNQLFDQFADKRINLARSFPDVNDVNELTLSQRSNRHQKNGSHANGKYSFSSNSVENINSGTLSKKHVSTTDFKPDLRASSPAAESSPQTPRAGHSHGLLLKKLEAGIGTESSTDSDDEMVRPRRHLDKLPTSQNNHMNMVVQVDDETDADMLGVLSESTSVADMIQLHTTNYVPRSTVNSHNIGDVSPNVDYRRMSCGPTDDDSFSDVQVELISIVREGTINMAVLHPNRQLAALFQSIYSDLHLNLQLSQLQKSLVSGMKIDVKLVKETSVQVQLTATVSHVIESTSGNEHYVGWFPSGTPILNLSTPEPMKRQRVRITSLPYIPGHHIDSHLGRVSLHFVKEDLNLHSHALNLHGHHFYIGAANLSSSNGPSTFPSILAANIVNILSAASTPITGEPLANILPVGGNASESGVADDTEATRFIQKFMTEIQAVVRAHVLARGGNALIGWRIECSLFRESLKYQAYGLISVSGDVALVSGSDMDDVRSHDL